MNRKFVQDGIVGRKVRDGTLEDVEELVAELHEQPSTSRLMSRLIGEPIKNDEQQK